MCVCFVQTTLVFWTVHGTKKARWDLIHLYFPLLFTFDENCFPNSINALIHVNGKIRIVFLVFFPSSLFLFFSTLIWMVRHYMFNTNHIPFGYIVKILSHSKSVGLYDCSMAAKEKKKGAGAKERVFFVCSFVFFRLIKTNDSRLVYVSMRIM